MMDTQTDILPRPADVELVPDDYFAPLDLAKIFGRAAPLEVDLGCGDGRFIIAQAATFPDRNFLGIEKLEGRVETACRKGARAGLRNLRVLRIETSYAIQYLLPAGSADAVHLLFPDPWPKGKHRRRRIVTPEFFASVHRLLGPYGRLRIVTDQEKYFIAIRAQIAADLFVEDADFTTEEFPPTTFERRYLDLGLPIYRLGLRKVS
ncbi:MAG TPA: tRNA (guanosine(46)-N7)-methyltransferase TrmB [Chthoniobacterales bacterium]|nr:tRNA (guanosine(46)-N7)-methyltransferase TrmB [Chthoniobacterales bacterium]